MLFPELPFLDRIDATADVGLTAFEFWNWSNKDLDAIARRQQARGLSVAVFSAEPPRLLNDPAQHEAFLSGLETSFDAARKLGCSTLIVLTGNERPGVPRSEQIDAVVSALRQAAPIAERAGMTLVLEPLNTLVDHKGYLLSSSDEGFDILDRVGSPAVKLLFDIYHQQIMEGNLTARLTSHVDQIGHVHIADVPGRYEPGTGEINYRFVLEQLAKAGYNRFVGMEFRPSKPTREALQPIMQIVQDIAEVMEGI
ncbi:MAG: TIM barrel protein [Anaerolineae bacterium]|nr:TIM barrel protein [Anaerolineae bacterium]